MTLMTMNPAQPDTNGSPQASPEAPPTKEAPLSPQFAAMARKEKALAARIRQFEEREKQFVSKESEYQSKYVPKDLIAEDPVNFLFQNGYTPEKLAQALIDSQDPQNGALTDLRKQIKALTDAQEKAKVDSKDAEGKRYEQAKGLIRKDVERLVTGNDEFETINAMGAADSVIALMEATLEEDGYMPTVEEAAADVEAHLQEEAFKYAQLKKIKARLSPPTPPNPAQKQPTQSQQPPMTTLSNRQTPTTPTRMTEKERKERAIAAFEGRLN